MAEGEATPQEQKPKKLNLKMIIMVAGVLLIEADVISAVFIMKQPKPADASTEIEDTAQSERKDLLEVQIAPAFQVENYMRGNARTMVTLEVWATYKAPEEEDKAAAEEGDAVMQLIEVNRSKICDKIRMRVSSANQNELKDPKLEVIKRVILSDIEEIIGEDVIEDILFPRWSPVDMN